MFGQRRLCLAGWLGLGVFFCLLIGSARAAVPPQALQWSRFFGGAEDDACYGMAIDNKGYLCVVGATNTSGLATAAAEDATYNGGESDAFVARFTPTGQLFWFTYLGGSGMDEAMGVAVDADGFIYVVGDTDSANFPAQMAWDTTPNGQRDVFVAKYGPSGIFLRGTMLGGAGWDEGFAIAVHPSLGHVFVTGRTNSTDFPPTYGAFKYPSGNSDAFVTCFDSALFLTWSTYLGGKDQITGQDEAGTAITLSPSGKVLVTGRTCAADFPHTSGKDQTLSGTVDAFVAKFEPTGPLIWSRFYGGPGIDQGDAIKVDAKDNIYLTGYTTSSSSIPAATGGYDRSLGGKQDAFVSKFDAAGTLLWGTYLGGSADDERGLSLALNAAGDCFVSGFSNSPGFPKLNPLMNYDWSDDMFLSRFSAAGQLQWSTLLGVNFNDYANALAIGANGHLLLAGSSNAVEGARTVPGHHGGWDVFLAEFAEKATAGPVWSLYR